MLVSSKVKYYIRLDDACPTMDVVRWNDVLSILDEHDIKPLIGVIPDNKDEMMNIDVPIQNFWEVVKEWQSRGYQIALHGYQHLYHSIERKQSINKAGVYSEFAGLSYDAQAFKIRKAWEIFLDNDVIPMFFFAPSHTFDFNTILALRNITDIKFISDTMGLFPYEKYNLTFIPQQLGSLKFINFPGYWTICLHPNSMKDSDIENLTRFITVNKNKINSFDFHKRAYRTFPIANYISRICLGLIKYLYKHIK